LTEVSSRELTLWMAFYAAEAAERAEADAKSRREMGA
jgi:hypothetical protein